MQLKKRQRLKEKADSVLSLSISESTLMKTTKTMRLDSDVILTLVLVNGRNMTMIVSGS
jgi:hypothetical protein